MIETKQRSDVRPVDDGPATLSSGEVAEQAPGLGHFTGTSSPAPNPQYPVLKVRSRFLRLRAECLYLKRTLL